MAVIQQTTKTNHKAIGSQRSIIHRQNISLGKSGELHHNWNKNLSKETKDKISITISNVKQQHYILTNNIKSYHLTSKMLVEFCTIYHLNYECLRRAKVSKKQYKGWTLTEVENPSS